MVSSMPKKLTLLTIFVLVLIAAYSVSSSPTTAASPAGENPLTHYLPIIVSPREYEVIPTTATFDNVTDIANAGDERLFIAERSGIIRILHPNGTTSVFLDIRDEVVDEGFEQGLFGLAFHSDYATNGTFFVSYTTNFSNQDDKWNLRLSQFQVSANPDIADSTSRSTLLDIAQDFTIHNGGALEFNPKDGRLYLGVGDDSQNLIAQGSDYKGGILRIDLESEKPAADHPATFQQLSPDTTAAPTISVKKVAKGLRNPWRMAVDPVSGDIYVGDVGDRSWEEIDLIPFGVSGRNFGWPCVEGPEILHTDGDCDREFDAPIYYYSEGCAVVIGEYFRFEGDLNANGSLIFADGCLRKIQSLSAASGSWQATPIGSLPDTPSGFLTTFGQDINGTIYAGVLATDASLLELYIPSQ